MTVPNVNKKTGIRYGIIDGNDLPYLLDDIQQNGESLNYEQWKTSIQEELTGAINSVLDTYGGEVDADTVENLFDALLDDGLNDSYCCDEETHEYEEDGVKMRTTWLGGAIHIWIFESPYVATTRLCSPCVPNCGNLDSPDPDGYQCYTLPPEWLTSDTNEDDFEQLREVTTKLE